MFQGQQQPKKSSSEVVNNKLLNLQFNGTLMRGSVPTTSPWRSPVDVSLWRKMEIYNYLNSTLFQGLWMIKNYDQEFSIHNAQYFPNKRVKPTGCPLINKLAC